MSGEVPPIGQAKMPVCDICGQPTRWVHRKYGFNICSKKRCSNLAEQRQKEKEGSG